MIHSQRHPEHANEAAPEQDADARAARAAAAEIAAMLFGAGPTAQGIHFGIYAAAVEIVHNAFQDAYDNALQGMVGNDPHLAALKTWAGIRDFTGAATPYHTLQHLIDQIYRYSPGPIPATLGEIEQEIARLSVDPKAVRALLMRLLDQPSLLAPVDLFRLEEQAKSVGVEVAFVKDWRRQYQRLAPAVLTAQQDGRRGQRGSRRPGRRVLPVSADRPDTSLRDGHDAIEQTLIAIAPMVKAIDDDTALTRQVTLVERPADDPDLEDVAQWWNQQHGAQWVYDRMRGAWHRWAGTHWQIESDVSLSITPEIVAALRACGFAVTSNGQIETVIRLARDKCARSLSPRRGLINFRNGTFDLLTEKLCSHRPEDHLTYCLRYPYAPGEFSGIAALIEQSIPDPLARRAYMAHIGLALVGDTGFHKSLLLIGPSRSGKTTLLMLANALCGADAPTDFAGPSIFSRDVEGKRARVIWARSRLVGIDELPIEALRNEEHFKIMASHGGVEMRRMRENEITANAWTPKLMMTANDRPRYNDRSGALTERLVIIECPYVRPEELRKPNLLQTLLSELPAFAAACLDAARAVTEAGIYPESRAMRGERDAIEHGGDPMKAFVAARCVLDEHAWSASDTLYQAYQEYCLDTHTTAIAYQRFTSDLRRLFPKLEAHSANLLDPLTGRKDHKSRGLRGIRLREAGGKNTETHASGTPGTPQEQLIMIGRSSALPHTDALEYKAGTPGTPESLYRENRTIVLTDRTDHQGEHVRPILYGEQADRGVPGVPAVPDTTPSALECEIHGGTPDITRSRSAVPGVHHDSARARPGYHAAPGSRRISDFTVDNWLFVRTHTDQAGTINGERMIDGDVPFVSLRWWCETHWGIAFDAVVRDPRAIPPHLVGWVLRRGDEGWWAEHGVTGQRTATYALVSAALAAAEAHQGA